jgi:4-hydroxy-4-methyl-2-oxoglutarate aldolase
MSPKRRQKLLVLYEDLRVADVRDAMDVVSLHAQGSMHHTVRPLWRTRAFGIAVTARYLPYRGERPPEGTRPYKTWSDRYYQEICRYPWVDALAEGDFVVLDCSGVDAGLMGSDNTLGCLRRGCRGFVSDAGVRDTDEVIVQKVPFWSARICQSMVQARLAYESHGQSVAVGGVAVVPGDVVVADGDGVIVVPQHKAEAVARHARAEHERDKANRRRHYQALGRKRDDTV